MDYNFKSYFSKVRRCLHNCYLYIYDNESKPYPFTIISDKHGNAKSIEVKDLTIDLTSGDKVICSEILDLDNNNLCIDTHSFRFIPSRPNINEDWWFFRIDSDKDDYLPHGNHDDGHKNYYNSDWPHHLIPGVDITLDILDFNLYLFLKLVLTYNAEQKYPFVNDFVDCYNPLIKQWKREIT